MDNKTKLIAVVAVVILIAAAASSIVLTQGDDRDDTGLCASEYGSDGGESLVG